MAAASLAGHIQRVQAIESDSIGSGFGRSKDLNTIHVSTGLDTSRTSSNRKNRRGGSADLLRRSSLPPACVGHLASGVP